MNEALHSGAYQGLVNMLLLKPGDKVCIFTGKDTKKDIQDCFYEVACEITGKSNVKEYVLEDYGKRPLIKFPEQAKSDIINADITMYLAKSMSGELESVRVPFIETAIKNGASHGHCPNITRELVEVGLNTDYKIVYKLSKILYDIVSKENYFSITTPAGTDLKIKHDSSILPWDYSRPIERGCWENLPDGETLCFPQIVNGTMVVDGEVGDNLNEKYGLISDTPLTVGIKNSFTSSSKISCPGNPELEKDFIKYVCNWDGKHELLTSRVGEFAFGTNIGLESLVGKLLQDEKFPSVHLAFGLPVYVQGIQIYWCKGHLDCIMLNPTVKAGNTIIMDEGEYSSNILDKL